MINILKVYYVNVHQVKPRSRSTDGTDRLQLSLDTPESLRGLTEGLDKRPEYKDQDHKETHTHTSPEVSDHTPQPRETHIPP